MKARPVKQRVLTRHAARKSERGIARDEGITPPAAGGRILDEAGTREMVEEQRARLYESVPAAVATIKQSVQERSGDAFELLDRTGVLRRRTSEAGRVNVAVGVNLGTLPVPDECSPYVPQGGTPEDERAPDSGRRTLEGLPSAAEALEGPPSEARRA